MVQYYRLGKKHQFKILVDDLSNFLDEFVSIFPYKQFKAEKTILGFEIQLRLKNNEDVGRFRDLLERSKLNSKNL